MVCDDETYEVRSASRPARPKLGAAITLANHLPHDTQLPLLVSPFHSLVRILVGESPHAGERPKLLPLNLNTLLGLLARRRANNLRRERGRWELERRQSFEF